MDGTDYGTWTRGSCVDYAWGKMVGDSRWSYNRQLPYFKKTETHHDPEGDASQHGFNGPIHTASISSSSKTRIHPLRNPLLAACNKEADVRHIKDCNSGSPLGVTEMVENWHDGKRQLARDAYDLSGVQIMLDTLVESILLEDRNGDVIATGARTISPSKEVIISAGVFRSAQLLMLSGIGSHAELSRHGITTIVDSPQVGRNFFDHMGFVQLWKLRHPERGQALGTSLWKDEAYRLSKPIDWIVFEQTPRDLLLEAFNTDSNDVDSIVMDPNCVHSEILVIYCLTGAVSGMPVVPFDGTYISTAVLGLMPTSRGSITLSSADPKDSPLIDPNYYATATDRATMRHGVRLAMRVMLGTTEGKDIVESELIPPGCSSLNLESSDAEIDDRAKAVSNSFYHAAGSLAMGKVVDTELCVKGVRGLRVVNASVIPVSIAAHYQVCIYALAEQAADIILAASAIQG